MPTAELFGERIAVQTEYFDKDLISSIPGARYKDGWSVPLTWPACLQLRGVFGPRLAIGPMLEQWAWELRQRKIEPALWLRQQLDAAGDPALYPFQRAGSQFLRLAGQALLGDEMGTGKTMQAIDALKGLHEPFPALVITPKGVKKKWARAFEHWWPGLTVVRVGGSATKRRDALNTPAHVYLIHWEAVRLHSRLAPYGDIRLKRCRACGGEETVGEGACEVHLKELNTMGLRTVIADEAHRLFDPHSKWTRAVWAVGHGPSVVYRFPLTGTPLANDPADTWGILHFIDPVAWPAKSKYIDRYCLKSWSTWGALEVIGLRPEHMVEFYTAVDPIMRCMPKDLVLPYLPPKTRDVIEADMSTKQAKAYREIEDGLITKLEDGSIVYATNHLVANTRLMQFASAYATVDENNDVKLQEPSSKLDVLEEVLEGLGWRWATKTTPARAGEPVVVFAESRQLLVLAAARLLKRGVRHWLLAGGMTEDQQDQVTVEFNDGPPGVLLVVIKAGGEGLDFTRSRHVVFLQRSWSMLGNKQAEDRCHRIGSEQHDKIEFIDIVAPDTVEESQIEALHEKLRRLEEITRAKQMVRQANDLAALQALEVEEDTIMRSELV